jgi:hypothetical protein
MLGLSLTPTLSPCSVGRCAESANHIISFPAVCGLGDRVAHCFGDVLQVCHPRSLLLTLRLLSAARLRCHSLPLRLCMPCFTILWHRLLPPAARCALSDTICMGLHNLNSRVSEGRAALDSV